MTPSKTLQKPFRDPFRDPFSNPSETLPGSGGPVAGNESLESETSIVHPFPDLAGLETQTQNAAFFERKRPKRKPWHRGKSLNRRKRSQCVS